MKYSLIKLTLRYDNSNIYINKQHIQYFEGDSNGSKIYIDENNCIEFVVVETPEQIAEMIINLESL